MDWTQSQQFAYQQYLYYQTMPNPDNAPLYGTPTAAPTMDQYDLYGFNMAPPQPSSTTTNGQCSWQQQHLMLDCAGLRKKKYAILQQSGQNTMQMQPPLPNPNVLHLPSGTVPFPHRQPALPQKWHSHCAKGCDYCWSSPQNRARYAQYKVAQEQANAAAGMAGQEQRSTTNPVDMGQGDSQPTAPARSQELVQTQNPESFSDPTSTSSSQSVGQYNQAALQQCQDEQFEKILNEYLNISMYE